MADQAPPPVLPHPWSRKWAREFDIGITVLLCLPILTFPLTPVTWTTTVLCVVQIAPLVWRRVHPAATFAAISAGMLVQVPLLDVPIWGQVALPISLYSVAAYAPKLVIRLAVGVGVVGAAVASWDWFDLAFTEPLTVLGNFLVLCVIVVASWALGTLARTRKAYVAELIDRGQRLEREAAQQAELAASDERARIAREMHDVVAHGLSVMIVQADGARYAVQRDPEAAARALETIADTGREALAEMRRMLGLLRSEDTTTGVRPQPGIADVEFLCEQSAAAGMNLTSDVDPALPEVASSVGLTVYRIVQEALTNVRKHAGPEARAHVRIVMDNGMFGSDLVVEVTDDGYGAAALTDGRGHGLIGMRERVAIHGGRLESGPRPGGGFQVVATIPLVPTGERP